MTARDRSLSTNLSLTERQFHVVVSAVKKAGGHGYHQDAELRAKLKACDEDLLRQEGRDGGGDRPAGQD